MFEKKLIKALIITASWVLFYPLSVNAATMAELEARIEKLERALQDAMQEHQEIAKAYQEVAPLQKKEDGKNMSLYGRLAPRVTHNYRSEKSFTDVTDLLSRLGIKADARINDDLVAIAQGEWKIQLDSGGKLGVPRLAFAGLKSDMYGFVGIGSQWNPYFNAIGGVVDIFPNGDSPFGYGYIGLARSDNLLQYSHNIGDLEFGLGAQFDGEAVNNHVDSISGGLGYSFGSIFGPGYIGLAASRETRHDSHAGGQNTASDYTRKLYGIGVSLKPTDDLYLAINSQYSTVNRFMLYNKSENGRFSSLTSTSPSIKELMTADQINQLYHKSKLSDDLGQFTLDVVASYNLGNDYTIASGVFFFDNGAEYAAGDKFFGGNDAIKGKLIGHNLSLIKQLNDSTKVFAEWLRKDDESSSVVDSLTVGMRHDFNAMLY